MTLGFSKAERLQKLQKELLTWELYQVDIDKHNVMFWFEDRCCLLNVAYRFGFRSADGLIEYVYDVQAPGDRKSLRVDSILRRPIKAVEALDDRRLNLTFDNGDALIIHDSPETRSAWFYRYQSQNYNGPLVWAEDDSDY
ncbi:MAG TPA: hypothetical protein VN723_03470 [Rhizomicrobium sp.]|jgi:hypothetical protein|nr:hypothetical protein [Rhizomicrobium sp.]